MTDERVGEAEPVVEHGAGQRGPERAERAIGLEVLGVGVQGPRPPTREIAEEGVAVGEDELRVEGEAVVPCGVERREGKRHGGEPRNEPRTPEPGLLRRPQRAQETQVAARSQVRRVCIDPRKPRVLASLHMGRVNMNVARRLDTWGGLVLSAILFGLGRLASARPGTWAANEARRRAPGAA